ncbi:nicotinate-nucleotide pyrophosphorylase [Gracilibacillus halophilus YIM-C55.5]|uniref:Probable nicotinate-nucleotide pyrophosphorylase [carboxylating] n=1 Tax=Gracilibacillus halophilus YIM-C55.5 TaxID=1308866 RepID=N4WU11_9BACI|nr:carboxylating nicotinate-nucleotide diphosphorylase [Gracilibacillus halophilus]ENH96586.1 nicotinate-nucleotide pyrophosphorylase [Gracilibacillus halophilus YIM-C55.5]
MNQIALRQQLTVFLQEDIGSGDRLNGILFSDEQQCHAHIIAKEKGIFCGCDIVQVGFRLLSEQVHFAFYKNDGDLVQSGDVIVSIEGPIHAVLTGERVILNLLQRLSGIATITKEAVDQLNSNTTKVCDTRKTTPGLRMFEKYAVTCGGGVNHRFGLYDAVMLKDNHIACAGSIRSAVQNIRNHLGPMVKVEVEVETFEQLQEAVEAKVDVIMLDNQTPTNVKNMLSFIPETMITEASGNITPKNIASYRDTGVHYISLGYLTHSTKALDLSLLIDEGRK